MEHKQLFDTGDESFSFDSHGVTLHVRRIQIPKYTAYRVEFSSNRSPITIVKTKNPDGELFWTGIPEGMNRENEAQGVGKLIEQYLQSKREA